MDRLYSCIVMTSLGSSVFQFPSVAAWLSSVETPSTSVSGDPFIACTPTPTSRRKKRKLSSKAQLDTPEPINYSSENRAQLLDKRWLYDMTGTLNVEHSCLPYLALLKYIWLIGGFIAAACDPKILRQN